MERSRCSIERPRREVMVLTMNGVFHRVAAAAIIGLCVGVAAAVAPADAQALPDGKGKDLVGRICVSCHVLSPITSSGGFSRREWEMVIQSMINMGADITDDEIPVLVDYLSASFPANGK